jgi:hypothetical protein
MLRHIVRLLAELFERLDLILVIQEVGWRRFYIFAWKVHFQFLVELLELLLGLCFEIQSAQLVLLLLHDFDR